ncbi:MAG: UDP-3-O-acyl-N-acetylglucosamine deacetylase [Pirellulales bacterium]|nr:UDP-3-O-acyl-N-acetylglucosamine deacetylase [Pirellulales bacterium]
MPQPRRQRTLGQTAEVRGVGYWSGKQVTVEFRPAEPHSGIVFVRRDLGPHARVPAKVEYRVEVPRRTALRSGEAAVEMIEHIMAALAGLRIDNCEVWVDAAEMPGCDGSSQAYVDALDAAGTVEQDAWRPVLRVRETFRLGDEDSWIEAAPAKQPSCQVRFRLDYGPGSAIGRQQCEVVLDPAAFRRELATARTFLLQEEADALRAMGLAAHVQLTDLLVYDQDGPVDNELRFPNECARHKALDLVGDLALVGCDLSGTFTAYRSGHRLNAEMAKALLSEGQLAHSDPAAADRRGPRERRLSA